jgi:SAM-dependent methyltransferase
MRSSTFLSLSDAVAQRYLPAGRFAHGFARGKLNRDPAFEYLLREGLLSHVDTVLDIGCGQGLLTGLTLEAQKQATQWPADWSPAPIRAKVIGLELMPSDVARARAAYGPSAQFIEGNMVTASFPASQAVVILDVLHYVSFEEQEQVLRKVKASLEAGMVGKSGHGQLLLRVGDAAAGLPFKVSNWVDALVTFVRGHRLSKLYCRPVTAWIDLLKQHGFQVRIQPLHEGTPFANVMLIAKLGKSTSTHA